MKRFFWAFETKQQTNVWLDLEKAERKIRTIHAAFFGLFPHGIEKGNNDGNYLCSRYIVLLPIAILLFEGQNGFGENCHFLRL